MKWKNTQLTTSWNYIKIYLMLRAKQTWHSVFFVFVQRVLFKLWHIMCGSCPLLALEFRPAEMGRVLMVLAKSWKKLEIMKKDWNPEILRIHVGTYTRIMKQDWNPEMRLKSWNKISSGKTKTLTFVQYYHVVSRPGRAPFFCAENSGNNWSCHLPPH